MTSPPRDPSQQPPDAGWQAPQHVWQQPSNAAPQLPRRAGRGLGCAVGAIVVVVALIVTGGVIWGGVALYHTWTTNAHARSATSSATKLKPQLQTVAGLNGLLTEIRNHFGDTMGYQLEIDPDSASIFRADPNSNSHTQVYYYSGAGWSLVNAIDSFNSLADLSKFDVTAVVAKLTSVPKSLGISDVKKIRLLINGNADGSVAVQMWVEDQTASGGDAFAEINPDGSVKALHPSS